MEKQLRSVRIGPVGIMKLGPLPHGAGVAAVAPVWVAEIAGSKENFWVGRQAPGGARALGFHDESFNREAQKKDYLVHSVR